MANDAYIKYEYANAAKLYEKIAAKNGKDTLVLSRLANCYKEINNYEAAEKYYNQLIALPGTASKEWLYFADMLKSTGKYEAAKEIYLQFTQRNDSNITNKIAGCDSAAFWQQHPNGYMIENMAYLNTTKSDWGAVFNPITGSVVFVSDSLRNTQKNVFKKAFNESLYGRTANYFQKIYAINNNKNDPAANLIHDFDPTVNSYEYHTGPVVFSSNYDSIYFTVTYNGGSSTLAKEKVDDKTKQNVNYSTRRLELFLSTQNATGGWNKPVPFPYNNAAAYSVGHAALSKDGKVLYFTSDMPGGVGGLDIWYCERLITGNWALPKNCGSNINTKDDEAFPIIGVDGNLYFASKGHVGMGGYDLFVAAGEKKRWGKPVNMGSPLNSSADDFYFYQKDDTSGFFASNRKGGLGDDDIYQYITSEQTVLARPQGSVLVLQVQVIDNASKQPIKAASLDILNTNSDKKWQHKSNLEGKTWRTVEDNMPYAITVIKEGYYSTIVAINTKNATGDTMKVIIPLDNSKTNKQPIAKVYQLSDVVTGLHEGDKFRINNIHYDFDKDNIRPDAALILDTLIDILQQYPSMVIELSSHTDSRGSDDYNVNLADRRAKSAVAYLINHGIERKRLIAKGFGEFMLLNGCENGVPCSEEEHQANRRTEVKILKL